MLRSAVTKSCSMIASALWLKPVRATVAGDVVPQNEQIRAPLAGLHVASAPQAGQAYLDWAVASKTEEERSRMRTPRGEAT